VVAADIGGMPEMVEDGGTGLLFEPGSVEGLRNALRSLVDDPRRAERLGRNARQRVESEFDAATHYERIMAVYRSLT
jgi:glycosyltransferase involved in cell wall biosynthesis